MHKLLHVKVPKLLDATTDTVDKLLEGSLQMSNIEKTLGKYMLSKCIRFRVFAVYGDDRVPTDEDMCPICGDGSCTWASTYVTANVTLQASRTTKVYTLKDLPNNALRELKRVLGLVWFVKPHLSDRYLILPIRDLSLHFAIAKLPTCTLRTYLPCVVNMVTVDGETQPMFTIPIVESESDVLVLVKLVHRPFLEIVDEDGENVLLAPTSVETVEKLAKLGLFERSCRVRTGLVPFVTVLKIDLQKLGVSVKKCRIAIARLVKIYETNLGRVLKCVIAMLDPVPNMLEVLSGVKKVMIEI